MYKNAELKESKSEPEIVWNAAYALFKQIQQDVEPHAALFWRTKPHKTGHNWWRMSMKLIFPSGFSVRLNYWWRNGKYWSIAN